MIASAFRAVLSVFAEIAKLFFRFVEAQPRLALIIAGIIVLLLLISSIAYSWLLLLGLLLIGAGFRLRQENL